MRALSSLAAAVAAFIFVGCTVHQSEIPPVSGPSTFAIAITVQVTPDTINQDGSSQSSVTITVRGPNGEPKAGVVLRVDTEVGGTPVDFGTLSARTVVTGADGIARTVFTAPVMNPLANGNTCFGAAGTCVTIVATPTGTDFIAVAPQRATLRLVPPGVILPPAGTPTAAFTVTPTPVNLNVAASFDASASDPGANATIASYAWTFDDGGSASGRVV